MSSDLDAWAQARHTDVFARELHHSLAVGPTKPLGAYGISTQDIHSVKAIKALIKAKLRHPFSVRWMAFDCSTSSGVVRSDPGGPASALRRSLHLPDPLFIYAWHESSLAALLKQHAGVLLDAGWPTTPEAFIHHHRVHGAPAQTPLWDLVATAYGDRTNPGRTDVLPGVSIADKLDAMVLAFGYPDPIAHLLTSFERPRLRVHVSRFPEDESPGVDSPQVWVAQGLESPFLTRGRTPEEAIATFDRLFVMEAELAFEESGSFEGWLNTLREDTSSSRWMRFSDAAPRCVHRPGLKFNGTLATLPYCGLLYEVDPA